MGWRSRALHGEFRRVERFSSLISVDSLAFSLPEPSLVIVDCRASLQNPAAGREAYAQGHLPRAAFAG